MNDKTNPSTDTVMILSNGKSVPRYLYISVQDQVAQIIPALIPGASYKLRTLCGERYWGKFSDGDKRKAGWCMTHLVDNNLLPLCFAEHIHEYPKYYRLK